MKKIAASLLLVMGLAACDSKVAPSQNTAAPAAAKPASLLPLAPGQWRLSQTVVQVTPASMKPDVEQYSNALAETFKSACVTRPGEASKPGRMEPGFFQDYLLFAFYNYQQSGVSCTPSEPVLMQAGDDVSSVLQCKSDETQAKGEEWKRTIKLSGKYTSNKVTFVTEEAFEETSPGAIKRDGERSQYRVKMARTLEKISDICE